MNTVIAIILLIVVIVFALLLVIIMAKLRTVVGSAETRTSDKVAPIVAREYASWFAAESTIRTVGARIPRELMREFRSIFERYLISMNNARATGSRETDIVYKMREELLDKDIARTEGRADEMVSEIARLLIERAKDADARIGDAELVIEGDYVRIGEMFARRVGAERIALLRKRASEWRGVAAIVPSMIDDLIGAMVLRYSAMAPGGQQWSIPDDVYDVLHKVHGATFEAFASPLNSRMIRYDDGTFASLFRDTDAPFGSVGSFFDCALGDRVSVVNPPFTIDVMEAAIDKCLAECAVRGAIMRAFIIVPHWTDADYYKKLSVARCLEERILIPRGRARFMHDEREIPTSFDIDIFVISSGMGRGGPYDDVMRAFMPTVSRAHARY